MLFSSLLYSIIGSAVLSTYFTMFLRRTKILSSRSRLASQLLVCMDELVRWRAAGAGNPADFGRKEQDDETIPSASSARNRDVGNDGNDQDDNNASSCLGMEGGNDFSRGALRSGGANVMVLAATNAPDAVDAAFLRPGRFDEVRREAWAGVPPLLPLFSTSTMELVPLPAQLYYLGVLRNRHVSARVRTSNSCLCISNGPPDVNGLRQSSWLAYVPTLSAAEQPVKSFVKVVCAITVN